MKANGNPSSQFFNDRLTTLTLFFMMNKNMSQGMWSCRGHVELSVVLIPEFWQMYRAIIRV